MVYSGNDTARHLETQTRKLVNRNDHTILYTEFWDGNVAPEKWNVMKAPSVMNAFGQLMSDALLICQQTSWRFCTSHAHRKFYLVQIGFSFPSRCEGDTKKSKNNQLIQIAILAKTEIWKIKLWNQIKVVFLTHKKKSSKSSNFKFNVGLFHWRGQRRSGHNKTTISFDYNFQQIRFRPMCCLHLGVCVCWITIIGIGPEGVKTHSNWIEF